MGLMDKLDVTQKQLWKSVDVIDKVGMDEPQVLQQKVKYPTTGMETETTAPLDEHRLVPLSELVESEPSFWEEVAEEAKKAQNTEQDSNQSNSSQSESDHNPSESSKQITLEIEYTDREENLEAALEKMPMVEAVDGDENRIVVACDSDAKMEVFSKAREHANIEDFSTTTR